MNKLIIGLVISIVIVIILIAGYAASSLFSKSDAKTSVEARNVVITKENFPTYVSRMNVVEDLPDDAVISLVFYDTEERYTLTKGSLEPGEASSPDLEVSFHSKYIPKLGNLCSAYQEASANREAWSELKMSAAGFAWKYRGVIQYRDCFFS